MPTIKTLAGKKTASFGDAQVSGGRVVSVEVTNGGAGYASAASVLTIAPPSAITFTNDDVSTATDTLSIGFDVFETGDSVEYSADTTALTGYSAGQTYFVIDLGDGDVQLADTYSASIAGSAIDITGLGTGTYSLIGETAIAEGNLDLGGVVVGVSITDPGSGYVSAAATTAIAPSGVATSNIIQPDGEVLHVMLSDDASFSSADMTLLGSIDGVDYATIQSFATGDNTLVTIENPPDYIKGIFNDIGSGEVTLKVSY